MIHFTAVFQTMSLRRLTEHQIAGPKVRQIFSGGELRLIWSMKEWFGTRAEASSEEYRIKQPFT
jgi:predicted GIY-YIG superfamily endonuclease